MAVRKMSFVTKCEDTAQDKLNFQLPINWELFINVLFCKSVIRQMDALSGKATLSFSILLPLCIWGQLFQERIHSSIIKFFRLIHYHMKASKWVIGKQCKPRSDAT